MRGQRRDRTTYKRRCHDCGRPTNDHRCAECWRKIREGSEYYYVNPDRCHCLDSGTTREWEYA
jgi:predicted amidophosphoribosyltransferase